MAILHFMGKRNIILPQFISYFLRDDDNDEVSLLKQIVKGEYQFHHQFWDQVIVIAIAIAIVIVTTFLKYFSQIHFHHLFFLRYQKTPKISFEDY